MVEPQQNATLAVSRRLRAAAERSGWGKRTLAPGRGLGLAFHYGHGEHFAEAVEVSVASVDGAKRIQVHPVWVVGDIGPIVDLSSAENQCQGCIVDALSTLMLELTMEGRQIEQNNFDRYPVARIGITPPIDVHFLATVGPRRRRSAGAGDDMNRSSP